MPRHDRRDAALILSRLKAAAEKRRPLRAVTNALRLVNGPGDGLEGLVLEQYDRHFSAQIFHSHWSAQAELLRDFLQGTFEPRYFILKDRSRSAGSKAEDIRARVLIDGGGPQTIVQEYGLRFAVDLNDGLNAGLFLDMRHNRHGLGRAAKGKRLLNCFSYTCSFGAHVRAGGGQTVNVDISKKALDRGRANYDLNGFKPSGEEFVRADAGAYLERAVQKNNRFDMVVLDPPSFARAGKGVFQIKKELPDLAAHAAAVLNPAGTLFVSTNSTEITYPWLESVVRKAFKDQGRPIKRLMHAGQDKDFAGTNTFKESHLVGLCLHI